MKTEIKARYLIFPVNSHSTVKKLSFLRDGVLLCQYDIRLDYLAPDFFAYVDVERYRGQTVEITCNPQMEVTFRAADRMELPGVYLEPFRPQIHFTTKNGWINDPNGLLYLNGRYHLFYQYNPAGSEWGNMHWGHAVSTDLLHWEERTAVLFPEKRGMAFSGCGIADMKNLLGMNREDDQTAVFFYTETNDPVSQFMAYSRDDCETLCLYEGNPVVPHIESFNRDPKVSFCEEIDAYVMALYLDGDRYGILKSDDLISWEMLQEVSLPGDRECPDLFPLCSEAGERRWVFSGAKDSYYVGVWKNGRFEPIQPQQSLYRGSAYAGQTFSGMPDGRTVRMVWDQWNGPVGSFAGQMGFPTELFLTKVGETEYLSARPVREIETLYDRSVTENDHPLSAGIPYTVPLTDSGACLIRLKGKFPANGRLKLAVYGREIMIDFTENRISVGEEHVPISLCGTFDLTVVVDRCSFEILADCGRIFLTAVTPDTVMDRNLPAAQLTADVDYRPEHIGIHTLRSVWEHDASSV